MHVHLVDATFELFRAYYSPAGASTGPDGRPVNAVRGLIDSLLSLLREPDVTHIGAATDYVIESWRNDVFRGYKRAPAWTRDLLDPVPRRGAGDARPGHHHLADGRGRGR